jgi:hypothetical protein
MATSRRISRFSVSRGARDRLRSSSVHSRRLTCNLRNQSSGSAGSCATPYSCRSIRFQPPASSTFLSEQTSQQYFSLRINQHQPQTSLTPTAVGSVLATIHVGQGRHCPRWAAMDEPTGCQSWMDHFGSGLRGAVHDRKRREKPSIEECRMPGWVEKDGLLLFQDIDSKSKVGSGHAEATVHCTGHVLQATSMRRMFPNSV